MTTNRLKLLLWSIVIGAGCAAGAISLVAQAAVAAPSVTNTFTVNTLVDAVDDNPGNGLCHTAANQCSLRAAIMEAVKVTTDVTINLPSGVYVLSIPPIAPTDGITNGDLNLTPPPSGIPVISINGAGMNSTIIDGNHTDRVFSISAGRLAIIDNLTIRNGAVPLFQNGGGLANEGGVILNSVRVFSNSAVGGLGGGGIYNDSRLTINNSLIDGNVSPGDYGGGIANAFGGSLRVNTTRITNNRAPAGTGGGIFDVSGQAIDVVISNTSIYSNYASSGGGIGRDWPGGPIRIINSAIYSNTAGSGNGGAIDLDSFNGGDVHLVNSTISGNSAHRDGGGIAIENNSSQVYLYNTTIVYNSAGAQDYLGKGGGIASLAGAVFTSQYSIIAFNQDVITYFLSTFVITAYENNECYGTFGYTHEDIMWNYNTARCTVPGGPYYLGNPGIGPLRNNGGSTWTHALLPGSVAIDQGLYCTDDLGYSLETDQRGFARFTDGACDIGAYEYEDNWIYLPLVVKNH